MPWVSDEPTAKTRRPPSRRVSQSRTRPSRLADPVRVVEHLDQGEVLVPEVGVLDHAGVAIEAGVLEVVGAAAGVVDDDRGALGAGAGLGEDLGRRQGLDRSRGVLGRREPLPQRRAAVDRGRVGIEREHVHVAPDLHAGHLDRADAEGPGLEAELLDERLERGRVLVLGAHRQLDPVGDRALDLEPGVVARVVGPVGVNVEVAALDAGGVDHALERGGDLGRSGRRRP
jgi:hypothetical protein